MELFCCKEPRWKAFSASWMRSGAGVNNSTFYLRDPRCGFFNWDWRTFVFFLLGFEITKVPLPKYSALYNLSSAKDLSCEAI